MDLRERLSSNVFPEAVKAGRFGGNVKKFVGFKTKDEDSADQFSSDVIFGDVTLETTDSKQLVVPVVIKTPRRSIGTVMDSSVLFGNEILFYTKILPSLRKYDRDNFLSISFCEFVHGQAASDQNSEEDLIVLKNLKPRGFKVSADRLYLDRKHVELVLNRLGRYHGLSFLWKEDDPEGYDAVVSQVKEIIPSGTWDQEFFNTTFLRGVEHLRTEPEYRERLTDLTALCKGGNDVLLRYAHDHKGPLSVVAHGDFTRNNVMFRYGDDGAPVEVAFFDFATIKHTSPAIDTSIILSCNVRAEDRRNHWDTFLQAYYDGLCHQMAQHPSIPSFESVLLDLRTNGVYGYLGATLILPWMMSLIAGGGDSAPPAEWAHLEGPELQEKMLHSMVTAQEQAGPKATHQLTEIVRHMIDKDYIFKPS